jgi:hypothetical protein
MALTEYFKLPKFILKKLPYHCKGCDNDLERAVFSELAPEFQEKWNKDPIAKGLFLSNTYHCKDCDKYYSIF